MQRRVLKKCHYIKITKMSTSDSDVTESIDVESGRNIRSILKDKKIIR